MSSVKVGSQTGQKGSFRRKAKKTSKAPNQEGTKLWVAASHLGLRSGSALDSASFVIHKEEEAIYLAKPELLFDMRSSTYVLRGTATKKPMQEIIQEMFAGLDLKKLAKGEGTADDTADAPDDLGSVPDDIDFANPDGDAAGGNAVD
jgi:hypothetical protein